MKKVLTALLILLFANSLVGIQSADARSKKYYPEFRLVKDQDSYKYTGVLCTKYAMSIAVAHKVSNVGWDTEKAVNYVNALHTDGDCHNMDKQMVTPYKEAWKQDHQKEYLHVTSFIVEGWKGVYYAADYE